MNRSHGDITREHGTSLVEFALTLPFLILLITGAFDLGWAVYINNSVAVAAREGARRALVVASSNNTVCTQIQNGLQGLPLNCTYQDSAPSTTTPGIFVQPANRNASWAGKPVIVTVQYKYTPITPIIGQIVGSGFMLSSSATMVAE